MKKLSFPKKAAAICLVLMISFQAAFARTETKYQNQSTSISPEKIAPMPFTGLAVKWHQVLPEQTQATLSVRFKTNDGWSQWNKLTDERDEKEAYNPDYPSTFIATNPTTAFQYKVSLSSDDPKVTPVVENIEYTYINAKDARSGSIVATLTPIKSLVGKSTAAGNQQALKVISRGEWGADESLRLYTSDRPDPQLVKLEDDFYKKYANELVITKRVATTAEGNDLTWPLEYPETVSKIIIHHTATTKNLDNPAQAIRDIYYWHAISRGWGDIGYNYVIDQQGNIYEGRYGGDGVVGAHAGKANIGSIGIAVLGNFEDSEVPEPVTRSLSALIKAKASKYNIDTMGYSMFRGENLPNVIGHRDVMSTNCPGEKIYELLPTLRALAKNAFLASFIDKRRPDQKEKYDYDMDGDTGIFQMDGGKGKTLPVKVKNTGSLNWDEKTYFMVSSTKASQKYLAAIRQSWQSDPIKKTVKPGETATFQIPLIASYTGGFTTLEVFPMVNGQTKVEKYLSIPVQIKGVIYSYELVGIDLPKTIVKKGEAMQATIEVKNTGDTAWKKTGKNKIMIGTENPRDHISRITAKPDTRLAGLKESIVNPGETGHFIVDIKAPARVGQYREYFAPVIEGISWLPVSESYIEFFVADTNSGARYAGNRINQSFLPSERKTVTLEFENTGEETWEKTGSSAFKTDITKNSSLTVTGGKLVEDKVAPGETGHVTLRIKAPAKNGIYRIIATPKLGSKNLTLRPVPLYIQVSRNPIVQTAQVSTAAPIVGANNIRIAIGFKGNPVISADGHFTLMDAGALLKTFDSNEKVTVTFENDK
ncbi:N-acetylmuramoyl-L-alanine amidase, partial [Patescibacteria group bacterium]|nr:N-acetylmuramoyl-L-alanine amidase [Patescibacteria group bacterium]